MSSARRQYSAWRASRSAFLKVARGRIGHLPQASQSLGEPLAGVRRTAPGTLITDSDGHLARQAMGASSRRYPATGTAPPVGELRSSRNPRQ